MAIAIFDRTPVRLLLVKVDSAERAWIGCVVTCAISMVGQIFYPAENAHLPRLVSAEYQVPVNALNTTMAA